MLPMPFRKCTRNFVNERARDALAILSEPEDVAFQCNGRVMADAALGTTRVAVPQP